MTTMKKLLISGCLFLVIFFLQEDLHAQGKERGTEVSANASQIYFELGGPGIIYSFNYDGRFGGYENGIGFRVGVGGAYWNGDGYVALPVQLNYLLGTNGKYLEIGAGATYAPGLNFSERTIMTKFRGTSIPILTEHLQLVFASSPWEGKGLHSGLPSHPSSPFQAAEAFCHLPALVGDTVSDH